MPKPYYKLMLESDPNLLVNALATMGEASKTLTLMQSLDETETAEVLLGIIKELGTLLGREIPDPEPVPLEPYDYIPADGSEISTMKLGMLLGCKTRKDRYDLKRELMSLAKEGTINQPRKGYWQRVFTQE